MLVLQKPFCDMLNENSIQSIVKPHQVHCNKWETCINGTKKSNRPTKKNRGKGREQEMKRGRNGEQKRGWEVRENEEGRGRGGEREEI